MRKRTAILLLNMIAAVHTFGQTVNYTPAQLHAHNDYEKPSPFYNATNFGFGSIEADIFLSQGKLLVAHTEKELRNDKTLERLYLKPLETQILKYNGSLSKETDRTLQLMIDIKTDALSTLDALVKLLEQYPVITTCRAVNIVISGNRPPVCRYTFYPEYVYFDGLLDSVYTPACLKRVPMFSENLARFTKWKGSGQIPRTERLRVDSVVTAIHNMGKKIRFWNAPDTLNAWQQLMRARVDWINTDHVAECATFLNSLRKKGQSVHEHAVLFSQRWDIVSVRR